MDTYSLHPLCQLFPSLPQAEFDALKQDIAAHGLRVPIVLYENQILDGANRYRACIDASVEPVYKTFDGDDPLPFVLSCNLHRRHLTPGQQAMIVAAAQDWAQAHGRGGNHGNQHGKPRQSESVHFATVDDRAAAAGVSRRTQLKADKVAKADPELAQRVARGEIGLPQAVKAVNSKSASKSQAKVAPYTRPIKGAKADALRAELREVNMLNPSLLGQYARLLLSVLQTRDAFSNDESNLLQQIEHVIHQKCVPTVRSAPCTDTPPASRKRAKSPRKSGGAAS
ncbi:hypothetical protein [Burkholderia sp. BCC0405]|uniref:ParB/RepB/Spo0J family partition protein n=1 Tax=Burkholderia sp. BCC0405 TaxID=2676298 RepID=UPI00158CFE61|nr:hypothetical protein [Burkholderia sp. BCC0405]